MFIRVIVNNIINNMISENPPGLNFINNNPLSSNLVDALERMSSDPQMETTLRMYASTDPHFATTIIKLLVNSSVSSSAKLSGASFLALMIKDHIESTYSNADF